jgi:hypothetical protein
LDVYGRSSVYVCNYCRFHDRLGVLLFVVRQRRPKEAKASIPGREGDKGRSAKRYDSNGKPIYD